MANVRAPYRVVPVRPVIRLNPPPVRLPVNHRPPISQRLPVLQPPVLSYTSGTLFDEIEEEIQNGAVRKHPTVSKEKHREATTRQITARPPTFILQQNYPRQQLPPITTRPVRRAVPKYSTEYYNTR